MVRGRAFAVWLVIIVAESAHGALRQLFLTPIVGDLRARQVGVLVGSLIIFAIALLASRWLGARSLRQQLSVGLLWVVLTIAFELGLGVLLGLPLARLLLDCDIRRGGFMSFGLLFMLLAPALAARARVVG
jgi:hypothetical protein